MSGIINPYADKPEPESDNGPKIRILACGQCKTIEELGAPFEGPPEFDAVLQIAVERHQDGVERRPHAPAALAVVSERQWNRPEVREQIRRQIEASFNPNGETGLPSEAYEMKNNFQEDAMACWERHLRTPTCSDYKSPEKLLVPNTAAERKEAGLTRFDKSNPATQRFLCEYCPVHSLVQQAARKRAGLYDK